MKLITWMILGAVAYVGYTYVQRYQSMEKEIAELRAKCSSDTTSDIPSTDTIASKLNLWMQNTSSVLEKALLSMPPQ